MAKQDLKWVPFIGQMLYFGNNIFIDRNNTTSAVETLKYVASEMKRKKVGIFIFPEGTRSHQNTNSLLPFKKVGVCVCMRVCLIALILLFLNERLFALFFWNLLHTL